MGVYIGILVRGVCVRFISKCSTQEIATRRVQVGDCVRVCCCSVIFLSLSLCVYCKHSMCSAILPQPANATPQLLPSCAAGTAQHCSVRAAVHSGVARQCRVRRMQPPANQRRQGEVHTVQQPQTRRVGHDGGAVDDCGSCSSPLTVRPLTLKVQRHRAAKCHLARDRQGPEHGRFATWISRCFHGECRPLQRQQTWKVCEVWQKLSLSLACGLVWNAKRGGKHLSAW